MSSQVVRDPWPISAKVILIAITVVAILVALPWIFMSSMMAAWCAPMMGAIRDMMGPGMMR